MNKKAINNYRIPVPKELLQKIDRKSSPLHTGKLRNAIDFLVPINTPVLAAADGIITFVKDDSNIGGPDPSYQHYTNFVAISHSNGEYSRYDHLSFNSSNVRIGQYVKAGDEIAKVGMTGFTYIPHLHFQVFVFTGFNIWNDYDTLEVREFIV